MTPEGTLNGEVFTDAFLQEEYGNAEKDFKLTLEKQEVLLEKIQTANNRFVQITSGNNEVRDSFLRKLASAYDAFETLVNHLKEGQKVRLTCDRVVDLWSHVNKTASLHRHIFALQFC